jgi:hypothetical protein
MTKSEVGQKRNVRWNQWRRQDGHGVVAILVRFRKCRLKIGRQPYLENVSLDLDRLSGALYGFQLHRSRDRVPQYGHAGEFRAALAQEFQPFGCKELPELLQKPSSASS